MALVVGMPVALFAGNASPIVIDRILPGDRFQLGGIGVAFFLGEIVACVVWSFVIFILVSRRE